MRGAQPGGDMHAMRVVTVSDTTRGTINGIMYWWLHKGLARYSSLGFYSIVWRVMEDTIGL
jgi:hypothetical protein